MAINLEVLIDRLLERKVDVFGNEIIGTFRGKDFIYSNFYPATVFIEGVLYDTSEHAFQALKSLDPAEREYVRQATTPGKAKLRGHEITLREDWEEIKFNVMLDVLRAKFTQHAALREQLLATGDSFLIEGNTWHDNTFGDCVCDDCKSTQGLNMLGKLLMQLREEFRRQAAA